MENNLSNVVLLLFLSLFGRCIFGNMLDLFVLHEVNTPTGSMLDT